jgi:hypothetical protein
VRKHIETERMRLIKHELNKSDRCRLWRNNVGFDKLLKIKYGLGEGSADLVGPLADGHWLAIETKSDDGRLSEVQRAWWKAAIAWKIRGGLARTLEGAWRLLEDAEAGIVHAEVMDYG